MSVFSSLNNSLTPKPAKERKKYGFTEYYQKAEDIRDRLDEVSPSICLAKWLQVSINLSNGTTQSCYHPPIHSVPLDELASNPSALHNTNHKKFERAEMLAGKRPQGCSYCWKVEDAPSDDGHGHLSDRHYKSSEWWAEPYFDEVVNAQPDFNIVPRYVEINFNQACNFKCMYCSPHISSAWQQEIEDYGPYTIDNLDHNNIIGLKNNGWMPLDVKSKDNPYVKAFWRWFPEIYRKLRVFRMTGGEPLMDQNTFKVLDYVNENPHGQLELSITSNMCPPNPKLLDKFIKKVQAIETIRTYEDKENFNEFSNNYFYVDKGFKHFWLYVSIDSVGDQAEYIRNGLNYETMISNVRRVLTETRYTTVSFINTFNLLSIPRLKDYLAMILLLRQEFGWKNQTEFEIAPEQNENEKKHNIVHKVYKQKKFQRIFFDIPLLKYPSWFDVQLAGDKEIAIVEDCIQFMEEHKQQADYYKTFEGFKPHEILKLKRNLAIMKEQIDPIKATENKRKFYQFISEHDRRRGTDFKKTFPTMIDFYKECEKLNRSES